ncbi:hypothetical protein GCM10027447_04380 [Glycomyces halotolerans]
MGESDRMTLHAITNGMQELATAVERLGRTQQAIVERLEALERQVERDGKAVKGGARRGYAQTEDLMALYRYIDPGTALPRMRGWAAGPELLRYLYEEVVAHRRSQVLECGSGTTTVILAYAVRALGSGRVTALEHDRHFAEATRRELRERGLVEWAEVVDAELADVELAEGTWRWYDPAALPEGGIDLLLVDGPPGNTGPEARYPALPLLADRLADDALVVLDDANRSDERRIAEKWLERHPRWGSRRLDHDRGTLVLTSAA